ncbi:MAG: SwmB domain-containing protein, partial [Burkholderiales bacterium]
MSAIATGTWHACALMTTGTVKCWGTNEYKQIANNATAYYNSPVEIPNLSGVSQVAAGRSTNCVLKSGGVQCWGGNGGKLGNKSTVDSATPVNVHTSSSDSTPLSGVSAIAMGDSHVCALMSLGGVKCWGSNGSSQLGRGSMTPQETTPADVSVSGFSFGADTTAPTFSAVAVNSAGTQVIVGFSEVLSATAPSAGSFSLEVNGSSRTPTALTIADSTVVLTTSPAITAGQTVTISYTDPTAGNDANAIQDSSGNDASSIATTSVSNHVITSNLSLHESQTCAVTSLGGVKCWGSVGLTDRPLGDGTSASGSRTLVDVVTAPGQPLLNVVEVSVGNQFACALTTAGGVKCWGRNADRQIGDGTTDDRLLAVDVVTSASNSTPLTGAVAIASSFYGACALMANGGVKCWGSNLFGQLGNGTNTHSTTPVDVVTSSTDTSPLRGVTALSGSTTQTTCALMFSGGVKCWGLNDYRQLADGTTTNQNAPVDVLAASGSTTPMSGAVSVTSGGRHTCALISDGGVKCWGHNSEGQLGIGSTTAQSYPVSPTGLTSGVTAVTAGNQHTCALKTNGGVVCWGMDNYNQLGINTGAPGSRSTTAVNVRTSSSNSAQLTGVIKISAGYYHTCAVMSSGGIKCWGYNGWSQLGDGTTTVGASPVDVVVGSASFGSDTSAPSFSSAAINTAGTTITLTYSEALSATTAAGSDFAVTVGGVSRLVSSVAVSGSTVVLTLASPAVETGQSVSVAYTQPAGSNAVKDSAGNKASSLSSTSVTNNSTVDTTVPSFVSAATNTAGTTITLTYSEALSATTAGTSDFTV